jgi:hypothetical protein
MIQVIRRMPNVNVLRSSKIVKVTTGVVSRMPTFVPFYQIAIEGQTTFGAFVGTIIAVYVNGVSQSVVKGDYSVSGNNIIFSTGLNSGDGVAGVYVQF